MSVVAGGCGLESIDTSATSHPIIGGSTEVRPGSEAVVFLGACSGVLINAHTVVTAEHCLPATTEPARTVQLAVRGGATAEACLTPVGARCGAWDLAIVRQPASDLVALRSAAPFADVDAGALPLVQASAGPELAYAHGYGVTGESDALGTRVSAPVRMVQYSSDAAYGHTGDGVRVCGGDSGGPLLAEAAPRGSEAPAGAPILLGVLSATQYDPADPQCTASAGLNRFTRIDPAFVARAAGPCLEHGDVLDCRAGGTAPIEDAAGAAPDTAAQLRSAGFELIDAAGVSAERIARENLVGVTTPAGSYLARVPAAARAAVSREPGGDDGQLVPLSPRKISLSGNGDQRRRKFTIEMGAVNKTSTTAPPACTGTLVGARLVRTAMHCLVGLPSGAMPWFTARYDGGPTTWQINGAYVTFNPRRAIGYMHGGNFFNFNCIYSDADPCIAEDWAILILPADVWQPQHVVPKYMGYMQSSSITASNIVTNSGYPACKDVSSPYVSGCIEGAMYGMNCNVKANFGNSYYTNCDTSGGHSGAGTYYATGGVRYLIGNHVAGPLNHGCANGTCSSADSGTSPWLADTIGQLRSQYSALQL